MPRALPLGVELWRTCRQTLEARYPLEKYDTSIHNPYRVIDDKLINKQQLKSKIILVDI